MGGVTNLLARLDLALQPCPLCDGCGFETLARHDRNLLGLTTAGCRGCGLVQTNPRPSAHGMDVFYRDHYRLYYQGADAPDQRYIADLRKDVRLAHTAGFFVDELGLSTSATVLDFGCGEGSLFAALRKAGFDGRFYGVELNAKFADFASAHGNARVSNRIAAPEPVDLVIVNHVLEHLADPIDMLRRLGTLLADGGRLYIDVPDAEEYRTIQDLHLAHVYHFSPATLRAMVERAGFEVERLDKHAPPHHPRSIRVVARPSAHAAATRSDPAHERRAWAAVRRSGRLAGTVRLRLRRIVMLRRLVNALRRTARRVAA